MAEQIVSPGVIYKRKRPVIHQSQQPVEVGAAIIGPAVLRVLLKYLLW
jgi:hypothetical protein